MTGLDQAIRARLDGLTLAGLKWMPVMGLRHGADFEGFWKESTQLDELPGLMHAALLAVLDLHRAASEDFTHIDETAYEFARRNALKDAVRVIAEKLGVEADGA